MANGESKKLSIDVIARIDKLEKGMARAAAATKTGTAQMDRSVKTARDRIEANFGGMAKSAASFAKGLAAPLLALGAAGAVRVIGDVANGVARIGDEAKRAGLGLEAFQELKFVAEQNRIGVDALTDGIKELNLRADEFIVTGGGSAAEAFKRLGFSAEELNTKLANPSALFTEIIGKLEGLDKAAQIRIADELFGGSGGEQFVQLIAQGEKGIRASIQAAHDFGAVMSAETIAKADELDRKFQAVSTTVGTSLKMAIVDAAAALNDFLSSLPKSSAEILGDVEAELSSTVQLMHDLGAAGGREFPELRARLDEIVAGVSATGDGAVEAKVALLELAKNPNYAPLIGDLNGVISTLVNLTGQAQAARAAVLAATTDSVGSMPSFGELGTFGKPATKPGGGGGGLSQDARDAAAVLKHIETLKWEREAIGLTARELAIANSLRQAGSAATESQRAEIENLVGSTFDAVAANERMTQSLADMSEMGEQALSGFINDLIAGKDAGEAFGNVLANLGSQLLSMGIKSLTGGLFGGGGGLFGFADGGYTGDGGKHQPAGVVHKGEYVFTKAQTQRLGVGNLSSLARGYAEGGLVGMPGPVPAGGGSGGMVVNFAPVINAPGADEAGLAKVRGDIAQLRAELPSVIKRTVQRRNKDMW